MLTVLEIFFGDSSGTFAVKTALLSPLLIVATGVALDYSRMGSASSDLQDAADAAAISAAAALMRDEKKWKKDSEALLDTNAINHPNLTINKVKVKKNSDSTVRVEATAKLDAMFPQIFGYPKYDIVRVSEATFGASERLELAIVLDTTNSMATTSAWSTAVSTMEDVLDDMQSMTGQNNMFVTLIPYQNHVNIGSHRRHWLSGTVPAGWAGCVAYREERIGSFEWALDDDVFTVDPLRPIDPNYYSYRPDANDCSAAPVIGPTNMPSTIASGSRGLSANQSGRLDEGLVWGWRAVSPKWAGRWGVPNYPSAYGDSRKIVVFMTDGNSTVYEDSMSNEMDLGWNNASTVALEHIEDLCTRMKDDGVELFILRLPGNDHAQPYLRRCATSPSHYLEGSSANELPRLIGTIRDGMQDELRLIR